MGGRHRRGTLAGRIERGVEPGRRGGAVQAPLLERGDQALAPLAEIAQLQLHALHAIEGVFGEPPVGRQDIGDQADQEDLDAEDEREHTGEGGGQVAGEGRAPVEMLLKGPMDQQPENAPAADKQKEAADIGKDLERLIEHPDAHNGRHRFFDIVGHRAHQPGLAQRRVGVDRHVIHGQVLLAGLDNGLQRIGVARDHVQAQGRLAGKGAEAAGRVGDVGARHRPHHARSDPLQELLHRREVLDTLHLPIADDHIGFVAQDGGDQVGDAVLRVLVVGIGVDDDVGPEAQAGVQPGLEGGGQPLVGGVAHHVVHPQRPGHFDGPVAAAVVDDQDLDHVDAGHLARDGRDGHRQGLLFIMAWDLDNQLHLHAPPWRRCLWHCTLLPQPGQAECGVRGKIWHCRGTARRAAVGSVVASVRRGIPQAGLPPRARRAVPYTYQAQRAAESWGGTPSG